MLYSEEDIEKIKEANPLFEILNEYTNLKKTGKNLWRGNCPIPGHKDKTPSFIYYENTDTAFCYGKCKTFIGDSIRLIEKIKGLEFISAVEYLIEKSNLQLDNNNSNNKKIEILKNKNKEFYKQLMKNKSAKKYLLDRGITQELIVDFKLGYCNKVEENEYKKFINRIIFPIHNYRNQLIGFGGRKLPKDENNKYPKYINTSSNKLFNKKENLYGLNKSKKEILEKDEVIIVEGYLDFILLYKYNVKNVVSTMGTNLSKEQIRLLKKFTSNFALFYDKDQAGEKAIKKSIDIFLEENIKIEVIEKSIYNDPAEIAENLKYNLNTWVNSHKKTIINYVVDKILNKYNQNLIHFKKEMIKDLKEYFSGNLINLDLEFELLKISKTLDISMEILKELIKEGSD